MTTATTQGIDRLDADELRELVAAMLAYANADTAMIGAGIDRLAAITGDLPTVLRDLADDVDAIRATLPGFDAPAAPSGHNVIDGPSASDPFNLGGHDGTGHTR